MQDMQLMFLPFLDGGHKFIIEKMSRHRSHCHGTLAVEQSVIIFIDFVESRKTFSLKFERKYIRPCVIQQKGWLCTGDMRLLGVYIRLGNKDLTTRSNFCNFSKLFAPGLYFYTQFLNENQEQFASNQGYICPLLQLISQRGIDRS